MKARTLGDVERREIKSAARTKTIRENFAFCERYKHFLKDGELKFINSLDVEAEAKYGMYDHDFQRLQKIVNRLTKELA